jgi:hypothetical protein
MFYNIKSEGYVISQNLNPEAGTQNRRKIMTDSDMGKIM